MKMKVTCRVDEIDTIVEKLKEAKASAGLVDLVDSDLIDVKVMGGATTVAPSKWAIGSTIAWGMMKWIVVHIDGDHIYCAATKIYDMCDFENNLRYRDSAVYRILTDSEAELLSRDLDEAWTTVIHRVQHKLFVPTLEMIRQFEYFKPHEDEEPQLMHTAARFNDRPVPWWLSSTDGRLAQCVTSNGDVYSLEPYHLCGVRLFVALRW